MRIKILALVLLLMIANQTTSLAPKDIPCKSKNENTEITNEMGDEIENEENEQEDEVEDKAKIMMENETKNEGVAKQYIRTATLTKW